MGRIGSIVIILACLAWALGAADAWAQASPRLVIVDNPEVATDGRLNYPLYIAAGRGYRIRCAGQDDEDAIIRGLGFLTPPSVQLNAGDAAVTDAKPQDNPLLCPTGDAYRIRLFVRRDGAGDVYYAQFPETLGSTSYLAKIYSLGCKGLAEAMRLDLTGAVQGDPTPFFGDDVYRIDCATGVGFQSEPQNFAQWCMTSNLDDEQRKTVLALLGQTPLRAGVLGDERGCNDAAAFLDGITSINLQGSGISDLAPLATLPRLTTLIARDNAVSELRAIARLPNLTYLDLSRNRIVNIAAVAALPNLRRLDLAENRIADLRPLSSLAALQFLDLTGNEVTDLTPINRMLALTELKLGRNKIGSATTEHLNGLSLLVSLDLSDNLIDDLTHIGRLPSTVKIRLLGNPAFNLQDMGFVQVCALFREEQSPFGHTVRQLLATANAPNCNAARDALNGLSFLNLKERGIEDVRPLAFFGNLTALDLSGNAVQDVTALEQLVDMRDLNLSRNRIADARPVARLPRLVKYDLSANPLDLDAYINACLVRHDSNFLDDESMTEVNALFEASFEDTCLRSEVFLNQAMDVDLGGLGLRTMRYFDVFQNALGLSLNDNEFSDAGALSSLPFLFAVDLSGNRIASLRNLTARNLGHLKLANNPIAALALDAPSLESIDLRGTGVRDIAPLGRQTALKKAELDGLEINYADFGIYCLVARLDPETLGGNRALVESAMAVAYAAGVQQGNCQAVDEWARTVEVLSPGGNLTSIEPLRGFTNLKELDLFGNEVTDLRPLAGLRSLRRLELERNLLSDLNGLPPSLVYLGLGSNEIVDVSPLANLTKLEVLGLSENFVNDVSMLGHLPLRSIGLTHNDIGTLGDIQRLKPSLVGNPICDESIDDSLFEQCDRRFIRNPPIDFPVPPDFIGTIIGPLPFAVEKQNFDDLLVNR